MHAEPLKDSMEQVRDGMPWEAPLICPDDTIRVKSFSDKLRLCCCFQEAPKLNPRKCRLFQRRVTFLGHVVSSEGISIDLTTKQVRDDRGESDAEMTVVGKAEVRIENLKL